MNKLTAPNGDALSRLCFGCMQFGGNADVQQSEAMFNDCRVAGINFFDTANGYTGGASEKLLGQFAKADREALILATKVAYVGGSGRQNILQMFDQSRSRLDLDVVDMLYLHRWDGETPLHETFETLAELQSAQKIRYIGVSNFAAWQVMKAQAIAATFGTKIDIIQPMYSLVKRQVEVEILPMSASEGFAVAPYSPLGGGLLTGKYASGGSGRIREDDRYAARYAPDWMNETANKLNALAKERDQEAATLAVAWVARHPAVTAPIISARNTSQLQASLAAKDLVLDDELYKDLTRLSPDPAPATDRLEES